MVARQYAKLQKHFDIIKPPKIMQDVEIEHDFSEAKKKVYENGLFVTLLSLLPRSRESKHFIIDII